VAVLQVRVELQVLVELLVLAVMSVLAEEVGVQLSSLLPTCLHLKLLEAETTERCCPAWKPSLQKQLPPQSAWYQ
jgi:hypothetical protein